jgi:hypothetical protein
MQATDINVMDTNGIKEMTMPATFNNNVRRGLFSQNEVEVNFSSELSMACCGEELRPFWTDDGRFISACNRCGQKYTDKSQVRYKASPWIGVDLDGTLAHDLGNKRDNKGLGEIGTPIKPMFNRLKKWIAEGKTVKIFTARASSPRQVVMIKKWLARHGLPDLEVTNVKDLRMIELWDDRCVQVMTNLGEPIDRNASLNSNPRLNTRNTSMVSNASSFLSRLRIFLTL